MKLLFTAAAIALLAGPAAAVVVTFEAPGVRNTTAGFDFVGVETFDVRSTGTGQNFVSDFGTTGQDIEISGSYSGVTIRNATQFGGDNGTRFADANNTTGYTLSLTSTAKPGVIDPGINYFGYWLSALDGRNSLQFSKDGMVIYNFTPAAVLAAVGPCSGQPHCGNPVPGAFFGNNTGEPYVFVNFFFEGQTFDTVHIFQSSNGAGYESDNHTVGFFIEQSGNTVPEPATWAMLITGFGLVGYAARRRGRIATTLA